MKKPRAGVIDYGMGNLHSVGKALSLQGAEVVITSDPQKLKGSDLIVLPGVGSFGAASSALRKNKLDDFVRSWIDSGGAYLGICLGYQLLFEESEEDPGAQGLGVFKGKVVRFTAKKNLPVPHMGWNEAKCRVKGSPLFQGISARDRFYFVHSYYPAPKDSKIKMTETDYGRTFCSSVQQGRVFASQFHPEKSGDVGLRLLKNILKTAVKK